jgi:hypothetical protein
MDEKLSKQELEEFLESTLESIEKHYGKEKAESVRHILKDRTHELIYEFIPNIKINFDLDFYHDSEYGRLYVYPDGKKNQRESILIEYNEYADMVYYSGHGDKTSVNYVCKPTLDEMLYCLITVVSKFRDDNGWTWKMPCETRCENKDLN